MNEEKQDKLLNIKTCGVQKEFNESLHYNRYEPTSYLALNELFKNFNISSADSIIDFGCGKGRLNFYAHYNFGAHVTGIEMNTFYYKEALENTSSYFKKHSKNTDKISFINCYAQDYEIKNNDNIFYFFNPFSVQIFMSVVENILLSVDKCYRKVHIILYYPSDDYTYYLENCTFFKLTKEIRLENLYHKDNRQKMLIYTLEY